MILALAVAASACAPRKRPTQMALIEPFKDWRMLDASVGMAKSSSVDPIAPCVRSLLPDLPVAIVCISPHRLDEEADHGRLRSP